MDNTDLSLLLYRYVCDVIGTEDVVNTRRQILAAYDNALSNSQHSFISSGSKAEGLDPDGSDVDLMVLCNTRLVHETHDSVELNCCSIVMDTLDCKPGYTQLKIAKPHECVLNEYCEYKTGEQYLSSDRYKGYVNFGERICINHGPCKSDPEGEYDIVSCLRCNEWVSQAQLWLQRARHQWASKHVIDTIVSFGVLFVPIGCKNSPNSDLEWRISFSFAEKLLIWSFNHTQLMCYALLKILLKDVIKHSTGDLLCSYFLKTVLFWICEEIESHHWKAKNIVSCFMSCLDRLVYCVRYKTCLHYFIPENDLFENRFNRQQHTILLSTLHQLRSLGWTCLLKTKTLRSFNSIICPSVSHVSYCGSFLSFLMPYEHILLDPKSVNMISAVYRWMRSKKINYNLFILSKINQIFGEKLSKEVIKCDDNKRVYSIYRQCWCHLMIGLNTDAVSGWLLLASFFYVNKQYNVCRIITSHCLMQCTEDKYLVIPKPPKDMQTHFELLQRSLNIEPHRFIKKHSIRPVTFEKHSKILPEEMSFFETSCHLDLSPAAFGLFLKFLCYHHLGQQREKVRCLHDLNMAAHDRYFMINNDQSEIANTFLSIAISLCGL